MLVGIKKKGEEFIYKDSSYSRHKRFFIFLREKCKEEIYSDEEFFLDLVSFYEQLIERVKSDGEKIK